MNQPCLPVPRRRKRASDDVDEKEVSFDNIESMDAMEYMAAVVQEANTLPEFFSCTDEQTPKATQQQQDHIPIQGSAASLQYLTSHRTAIIPPPSTDHSATRTWVDGTLANFSQIRSYLNHIIQNGKAERKVMVPAMKDRAGWHIFCVGQDEARGGTYFDDDNNNSNNNDGQDQQQDEVPEWRRNVPANGHEPVVSLLLQMDQVMIRQVVSHLTFFVRHGWSASPQRTAWLYALLARLERPIHRDDAATLFTLLKELTTIRSKVVITTKSDTTDELSRINILICIVGLYFEQAGGFHNVFQV